MVLNNTSLEKKIEELMGLRARMWAKKIRQTDIARKLKISQGMVSHVLNGRKNSPRVIETIKEAINANRRLGTHKL